MKTLEKTNDDFLKVQDATLKEEQLLDNRELRDKNINKYEVLDRVKKLLLIPETNFSTTQQVADFYDVDKEVINMIVIRNKQELEEDGLSLKTKAEVLNVHHVHLEIGQGSSTMIFDDGTEMSVPNRGLRVFPRRAILRVGMLLRDSQVAREVRTQLLNIEEKTSEETKTADIVEEQSLAIALGMAYASGDRQAIIVAHAELADFKNRHIKKLQAENSKLETTNKALANGILEWEDRSRLNFAVRKLASVTGTYYAVMWNELYRQLKNKYHMDLKARGDQPWLRHVKEDEWKKVIQCFSALCKYYEQEPADMFVDLQVE